MVIVAGLSGWKSNIGRVGGNQSDYGCPRAELRRESLSLSWWNKENRVLIFLYS
jgi:hypothetical protein